MEISAQCREAIEAVGALMEKAKSENTYYEDLPGRKMLECYPDILAELSKGTRSVIVTGTNGKTITCRMLSSILDEAGFAYFSNSEGANMEARIVTLFCENYLWPCEGGRMAVLECDEGYLRRVLPKMDDCILVITNIFPDQIERFHSEEYVADMICEAMEKSVPSVCFISRKCHFYDKFISIPGWKFIEFDDEKGLDDIPALQIPGEFNRRNALLAKAVGDYLGIGEKAICKGLAKTKPAFGRFESFTVGDSRMMVCLAKNPEGFSVISKWLLQEEHDRFSTLVLAMNCKDGDDKDILWLKQNDYSVIVSSFSRIIITGNCAGILYDIIADTGKIPEKISMDLLPAMAEASKEAYLIIANYSAMQEIRQPFVKAGYIAEYWET